LPGEREPGAGRAPKRRGAASESARTGEDGSPEQLGQDHDRAANGAPEGGRLSRWGEWSGSCILAAVEHDATATSGQRPPDDASERARLDELGRESFPASDPPSTWAGTS
jgi:hypothetical protein